MGNKNFINVKKIIWYLYKDCNIGRFFLIMQKKFILFFVVKIFDNYI